MWPESLVDPRGKEFQYDITGKKTGNKEVPDIWTETPDMNREYLYAPAFRGIYSVITRLRWLQHGRLHLYVLYVAITIIFLLFWSFGFGA